MINLRDARITDGLPRIVAEQPWAQVLSAVYGELQDRMFEYLDTGMTFSEVDTCDEGVLDQMAVYLKIEWYDSTADVETKRRIVRTAIEIQRYAGTVKAVREQASAVYPDSEVEEWFDYGGTPGFWRLNVNITEAAAQYHTIREMEDLLGYTKRLSAHLVHGAAQHRRWRDGGVHGLQSAGMRYSVLRNILEARPTGLLDRRRAGRSGEHRSVPCVPENHRHNPGGGDERLERRTRAANHPGGGWLPHHPGGNR